MEEIEKKAVIEPVKLSLNSEFQFKCHKEVSCFTKCCRGIDIMLTPYDIIKMKTRLGLSADEFLAIYTEPRLLEKTDLPVVTLKLLDDKIRSCPFVKDKSGCMIYEDRPTTCRYYPLGVGSLSHTDDNDGDDFFFTVKELHCKGFDESKVWSVRDWRNNQGVDVHDEMNAGWTDLMVRKRSFPANVKLSEKSKIMFFTVCYNIDKFRRFVFESSFLSLYKINEDQIEKLKNDDIELLKFGFNWLKGVFFKEGGFKINEANAKKR